MSGRVKHMQRSHYSYHNGADSIYRNFENRAYAKRVKKAPGISLAEKMANTLQKLRLPGFANKNAKYEGGEG